MCNYFLESCTGFYQLITKLSTQNLQNKNVWSHAIREVSEPSNIMWNPEIKVGRVEIFWKYSNIVMMGAMLLCWWKMSPKSNLKSDLKFGQINFNHGLTDELREGI